ncbi:uncharacterized protein LOC131668392 [Phymastichus coffea]|uniref:uncharacterized protein LOC131668392 n=1 Tax=Phymastichus coffea TaxID=108790 RepID=UPI00273BE7B3|nr:uncharacterized protein LOC131668392 [Phymastichus coffea]
MSYIDDFYLNEIRSLSELPLEKLVQLKSSFAKKNIDQDEYAPQSRSTSTLTLPVMPLKRNGNKYPISRYDEWEEKGGKDSKISKIFQLTICTLSFLAFGGYLLALIISAIRRNQMQANPGQSNVIVLSGLQSLTKVKRPKREFQMYNPMENDYDPECFYRGMIMLSDKYSYLQYH